MRKWIIIGGMLCGLWASTSYRMNVLEDRDGLTKVEFNLYDYRIENININGILCSEVYIPEHPITFLKKGYPELPKFAGSIIIPDEGVMQYRILDIEYETKKVNPVIPSKGNLKRNVNPEDIPYEFSKFYEQDEWFPMKDVEISEPFILREFRGLTIYFYPFQYNPRKGELKIAKRIVVEIYKERGGGENVLIRRKNTVTKPFTEVYKNFFLNYEFIRSRYPFLKDTLGNMLIITADAYYDNLIPFIFWKRKIGIPVEVESVSNIGNNSTNIKNYIQNKYNTEGVTWILLVGNASDVATIAGTYDETSDPVYGFLAGNDSYFDAFVSRFSANDESHVDLQVAKVTKYERYPPQGSLWSWYHKGLGTASSEGNPPDSTRMNWLIDTLLAYTYTEITKVYEPWGTDQMITNALNEGRSLLNHIGHGNETGFGTITAFWFDINDIAALNNTDMLPFVFLVACLVGDFDAVPICCTEAWMWTGTVNDQRGAIGAYGASVLQSWVPPTVAQAHAMGILKREEATTIGGICFNGSMYMYEQTNDLEMLETWHIFGDASLDLRTDIPDTLSVTHLPFVNPDPVNFTVQVLDNNGVTPIQDALVCLWISTQTPEIHVAGYTNASGEITFNINPQNVGDTMWVTVSKHNYRPYEGYAIVQSASGPYIVKGYSVASDPQGNNNGIINPGEMINYSVYAKNVGSDPAYGVYGILTSTDATVTQDSSWFGNIAAGDSALGSPVYQFQVPSNAQNNQNLLFTLTFHDSNDSTWTSNFSLKVYKPVISKEREYIANDGNGNGVLEPNEQGDLIVVIKNTGGDATSGVSAKLISQSALVSVFDSLSNYGAMQPGDTLNNLSDPFTLYADPTTPTGYQANFLFITQTEYDIDTFNITITVGKKHYFVWDPDPNHSSGPVIDSLLQELGYSGDYSTTLSSFTEDLYMALFVCVGIYSSNYIITSNSSEALTIVNFAQNTGGRVYLEGGDVWYYDPLYQGGHDFGPLFGINPVADGSADLGPVQGQTGTFTQGMNFNYSGENSWIDHIQSSGGGAFNIFYDTDNAYYCGVANDAGTYKTVGMSFELAGLVDGNDPSTRKALVDSIMHFFGIHQVSAEEGSGATLNTPKVTRLLGAFPNPLSRNAEIVFDLANKEKVNLLIYDITGRCIQKLINGKVLKPGNYRVKWNTEKTSQGVYFIKLETETYKGIKKGVVLR